MAEEQSLSSSSLPDTERMMPGGGPLPVVIAIWNTDVQDVYTFFSNNLVTVTGPGRWGAGAGNLSSFDTRWSTGIYATCIVIPQGNNKYLVNYSNSAGKQGHFYAFQK